MWIFAYGSIIWKPGFEYEVRRCGYIRGWKRRFYQASPTHRGRPSSPGRVATLMPESEGRVWGAAYKVAPSDAEQTVARLDVREKDGYERHLVDVFRGDDQNGASVVTRGARVYIAGRENPNFTGREPIEQIARRVVRSRGQSGPNVEYVFELAAALRRMNARAPHVFALEKETIRQLDPSCEGVETDRFESNLEDER